MCTPPAPPSLTCWFCAAPAQRMGWGFTVCGNGRHAERARLLGDPSMDAAVRAGALELLDYDERRMRANGPVT